MMKFANDPTYCRVCREMTVPWYDPDEGDEGDEMFCEFCGNIVVEMGDLIDTLKVDE